MKWFVAKVCFQILTATGNSPAQFDEQFRLIRAHSETEAYHKAQQIGLREEESFLNVQRLPVHWKWLGVTELSEVHELQDGIELYSGITELPTGTDYLQQVKNRSRLLHDRVAAPATFATFA